MLVGSSDLDFSPGTFELRVRRLDLGPDDAGPGAAPGDAGHANGAPTVPPWELASDGRAELDWYAFQLESPILVDLITRRPGTGALSGAPFVLFHPPGPGEPSCRRIQSRPEGAGVEAIRGTLLTRCGRYTIRVDASRTAGTGYRLEVRHAP